MNLPLGLAIAGFAGLLGAVPAIWAFCLRRSGMFAGAIAVCGVGAFSAWLFTLSWDTGWAGHEAYRTILGGMLALPASIAALLLIALLLDVCDQIMGAGARLRLTMEALTVASGIFMPLWALVLRPGKTAPLTLPGACVPVMVSAGLASVVIGLSAVLLVRAEAASRRLDKARRGTARALLPWNLRCQCGNVAIVAFGSSLAAIGACYGAGALVLAGSLMVLMAGAARASRVMSRRGDGAGQADPARWRGTENASPGSGLATALPPVLAMSAVAAFGFSQGTGIDVVTALVGIANGFFLVGRQYLAYLDIRQAHDQLTESESHYRELAHTDPLTGLANRRGLLRTLYLEATSGASCVLLALDLDGFKNVNDVRGHDAGDAVLIEVGQRLRLNLRPADLAARLGGDEFAVLLWGSPGDAREVAHRLRDVLEQPYQEAVGPIYLSASIGMAGCASAQSIQTMLRNADVALRAAKQRGKNRVELYDETYDRSVRRATDIEHALREARAGHELSLAFQPVVALPQVRVVGAEALLRWDHPVLGSVPPGEFIPIAEETGQIEALGSWVLDQAGRQLARWLAEGNDVWVSVNVSPRELHSAHYVVRVQDVLRRYHVPPARLVLEVTEHAVATDVAQFRRTLAALRELGVRIALDDFGAGYSSLSQLRSIPVDILKIDQLLVSDRDLVDVVVRLGRRLGLQVIAEGMCEPEHRALVEAAGCPYGQGYLFGRGVPAEHLEAMLATRSAPESTLEPPRGAGRPATSAVPISGSS